METNKLQKNAIIIILIAVGLFFVSKISNAQTWVQMQDQVKENTQQINNVEDKMVNLNDNYKLLYDGAKNQNDQLGNQISFASYLLGGVSFIFTVLGIFLAWYINRQYEKIKEMKDTVESTKKYIDEHNKELYRRVKRDETIELLNRLKEVPEDITNICPLLLSRNLLEEDYQSLRESYLKIKNDLLNRQAVDDYIVLLTQHFVYQSLKDAELRTEIITLINPVLIYNMFDRDIRNFFNEVFKFIKEFGINDEQNKTMIKNLFYHYSRSKFQTNIELQNYIKEIILKYNINTIDISNIAKEQAPADTVYINWLDSIFKS